MAAFGQRLKLFLEKHHLSARKFADVCDNRDFTTKSSIHRFVSGNANPNTYERAMLVLEECVRNWMFDQGYSSTRIESDLEELFNFEERDMIVNRCLLTSDAVKFFGLKADPFDVDRVPGDDEIFTDKHLDEVAARVRDAVLYKRFVCVVGAVGTGKTSMKIRIARELAQSRQKCHLIYPEFFDMNAINVGAIAGSILEEFEVKVPRDSTARVRRIKQQLTSLEKDDARVALVFDECHRLNEKVLVSLKNFWEMTNGGYSRLLGVVLFGQPKFVEATLRDSKFREIAERVQIVEMPSIEKSAKEYLTHKIAAAGGDINTLFEPKAVQRICSVAKTPLSLGNLANNSLMEAFKLEETQVVSQMLNLPDAPKVRQIRQAA